MSSPQSGRRYGGPQLKRVRDVPFWWHEKAACKDATMQEQEEATSEFVSVKSSRNFVTKFCAHCPVARSCENWADKDYPFSGIAGGFVYHSRHTGRYKPRSKSRVPVMNHKGYRQAINRNLHPTIRVTHLVAEPQAKRAQAVWHAVCGALVTMNRTIEDEVHALSYKACEVCITKVEA
jgi:Transcription factor WhiB